jgi:hypothetical protein
VLLLGSVGAMNGMRQIPALGIAIPQLLNISQKLLAGDPLKHLRLEQAGCQHQVPASVKPAHLLSLRLLLVYTHPFIFFFCYAGDCVLYDEG